MGQQQLLLVILVTIIVGIATVVAINAFSSAADSANLDAVRNDLATIGSSSQSYYRKPDMMGGGGGTFEDIKFDDITFTAKGITTDGAKAQNRNGRYTLNASAGSIVVTASPASDPNYTPGNVDSDGTLTGGTDAATTIQARVCPDKILMASPGESAGACP